MKYIKVLWSVLVFLHYIITNVSNVDITQCVQPESHEVAAAAVAGRGSVVADGGYNGVDRNDPTRCDACDDDDELAAAAAAAAAATKSSPAKEHSLSAT